MDKETKQQIDILQTAILEQGKTISNIMKAIPSKKEKKYNGLLVSDNFLKRFIGFVGYSLLGWLVYFIIMFTIGFIGGLLGLMWV